jgi:hypothetical protein
MRSFDIVNIVNIVNNVICQTGVDRIPVCHDNTCMRRSNTCMRRSETGSTPRGTPPRAGITSQPASISALHVPDTDCVRSLLRNPAGECRQIAVCFRTGSVAIVAFRCRWGVLAHELGRSDQGVFRDRAWRRSVSVFPAPAEISSVRAQRQNLSRSPDVKLSFVYA